MSKASWTATLTYSKASGLFGFIMRVLNTRKEGCRITQISFPNVVPNSLASNLVGMSVSRTSSPWYYTAQKCIMFVRLQKGNNVGIFLYWIQPVVSYLGYYLMVLNMIAFVCYGKWDSNWKVGKDSKKFIQYWMFGSKCSIVSNFMNS